MIARPSWLFPLYSLALKEPFVEARTSNGSVFLSLKWAWSPLQASALIGGLWVQGTEGQESCASGRDHCSLMEQTEPPHFRDLFFPLEASE